MAGPGRAEFWSPPTLGGGQNGGKVYGRGVRGQGETFGKDRPVRTDGVSNCRGVGKDDILRMTN